MQSDGMQGDKMQGDKLKGDKMQGDKMQGSSMIQIRNAEEPRFAEVRRQNRTIVDFV
jgi:hypothetical protein